MKTKNLFDAVCITANCLLSTAYCFSQAPNFLWAKSAGESGSDEGNSIAVDGSGNNYITGYFNSPTITFGSTTLTSAGSADIFIAKYDPSGNVLWAKSAGGSSSDVGKSIAVDESGNSYVTGPFSSPTITFGSTTLTNTNVSSGDIFIAKYDPSGNVLWAKSAGGFYHDMSISIAVDGSGNSYVTGGFQSSTITFGTITLTNANTNNSADIFIAKYDPSGNLLWAKSAGGSSDDYGNSIAVDGSGNSYVTGYFGSPTITFGSTTLTSASFDDIFIVKYNPSGNVLWAKSAGGSYNDYGSSVSVDGSGNTYVTGSFRSSTITFGSTTLTSAGVNDIFIAKYDQSGNVLWAKRAGGSSNDYGNSIAVDGSGNSCVIGHFISSTITFDSTTLTNAGSADIFIAKYDPSGNVLWAKSAGGSGGDYGYSIAVDGSGNSYVTGSFNSPTITFGSTTLTSAGVYDIFIAKLDAGTGVNEWSNKDSFSVFPNPSSGNFTLSSKITKGEITIYNVMGEKVYSSIINHQSSIINLGAPNGIYFLQIKTDEGTASQKIIINK